MKKFLVLIMCVVFLIGCGRNIDQLAFEDSGIKILIDDNEIQFGEFKPFIDDNKILQIPLETLAGNISAKVNWNKDKLQANIIKGQEEIIVHVTDNNITLNDKTIPIKSGVYQVKGKVYVPAVSILGALGYNVESVNDKTLRVTSPIAKSDDFGIRLAEFMPIDKNYVFSPLSIKLALAMLANGAEGNTRQEVLHTLGIRNLNEYNEYVQAHKANGLTLANSIWLNTNATPNTKFADTYKTLIKKYFNGEVSDVDNSNAVQLINSWVAKQTNNKITEAISRPEFLAALINTIYLKAQWQTQFDVNQTQPNVFTDKVMEKTEMPFMHNTSYYPYYADDDLQMLSLPYKDSTLSMDIVIPKTQFELSKVIECFDKLKQTYVNVLIPKFKTEFKLDDELKHALNTMGISLAFTETANLSAMFNNERAYVDKVLHNACIEIDEKGTEAAAATTVVVENLALKPNETIDFIANKPFYYFIRDSKTGEVIFIGSYAFAK